jgi:hypothetical protein
MARQIVTSENKAEYDDAVMSRRLREYGKDSAAAEKSSSLAKDSKSHFDAQLAHQQASVYAHPPENIEKHLEQARHHKKESAKHAAAERRKDSKEHFKNKDLAMQKKRQEESKKRQEKGFL